MTIHEGSLLILETLTGAMFGPYSRSDAQDRFDRVIEDHPWGMWLFVKVQETSRAGVHVPPYKAAFLDRIPHGIRDPAEAMQHAARSD